MCLARWERKMHFLCPPPELPSPSDPISIATCTPGSNSFGELGLGLGNTTRTTLDQFSMVFAPVAATEGAASGWSSVSAGRYHTCAISAESTAGLFCWVSAARWGVGCVSRRRLALSVSPDTIKSFISCHSIPRAMVLLASWASQRVIQALSPSRCPWPPPRV